MQIIISYTIRIKFGQGIVTAVYWFQLLKKQSKAS